MIIEEVKKELTGHIIPFWNKLRDDENGGFYGFMSYDLKLDKQADKGVILHARILWFYSKAYEDDWITAVIKAPTIIPKNLLDVNFSKMSFILFPATDSNPLLIICIPYRNNANPPNRPKMFVLLTFFLL